MTLMSLQRPQLVSVSLVTFLLALVIQDLTCWLAVCLAQRGSWARFPMQVNLRVQVQSTNGLVEVMKQIAQSF